MKNRQLPGRREALSQVLKNGIRNSGPEIKALAGFGKPAHQPTRRPEMPTMMFSSAVTPEEAKNLPF